MAGYVNTAKGLRGITVDGEVVWIEAGETVEITGKVEVGHDDVKGKPGRPKSE